MATTWTLDTAHSEITFKVKHMMISNVKGRFNNFNAILTSENDDFSSAVAKATIEVNSIDTNNNDRDKHLCSAEFFDAEKFPVIEFESTSLNGTVQGFLTMRDVRKPIDLKITFGGVSKDPWGNTKSGFSFEGKINRKEFDLGWNAALETGGVMVSDDVQIAGDLQFVKQA